MSKEMEFFIFLIESYAHAKQRSAADVLQEWDERGITQEIYDGFELYHIERIENAFEDIDCLVETGNHAW